jgi:hypothetical protein
MSGNTRDLLTALLPVEERAFGPEHPDTLANRHELAHWTKVAGILARREYTG